MLTGKPGHKIQRDTGRPSDRLVFMPDEPRQSGKEVFIVNYHFVVLGTDMFSDRTCVWEFSEAGFLVANGKSLERLTTALRRHGGYRIVIEAATQENSQGDIAHQV